MNFKETVDQVNGMDLDQMIDFNNQIDTLSFYAKGAILWSAKVKGYHSLSDVPFDIWAQSTFGIGRSRVYQLLDAYQTIDRLHRHFGDHSRLPEKEYHCRILSDYAQGDQEAFEIWEDVCTAAKNKRITGRLIKKVIELHIAKLKTAQPEEFERQLQMMSPGVVQDTAPNNALFFKPLDFTNYIWDLVQNPHPTIAAPVSKEIIDRTIIVQNFNTKGGVEKIINASRENLENIFMPIAQFEGMFDGMKLPANLWPVSTIQTQFDWDEATQSDPNCTVRVALINSSEIIDFRGVCPFDWVIIENTVSATEFYKMAYEISDMGIPMFIRTDLRVHELPQRTKSKVFSIS